jgi:Flp pilus assembly protein TadD/ketosteroid isomerase-like protein
MLHRIPMRSRLAAALAAAFLGVAALAWAAPADDLREAQKLSGQGKVQPALEKVDVFLRAQPKDPQGRFLRGILLTELKRTPEAIQAFTSLTEDFPELPEPYNNLAVLYASQGNYDKAKSSLELAIHTHPSYATAHENLGDIYAQLASRAYDRALQLDKNNPTAQSKLAMIKELFSSSRAGGQRPEASRAAAVAKSEAARVEPPKPAPAKVEPAKVQPAKAEPARVEPPKVATVTPAATPAATPAPAAATDDKARVAAAIEGWARAWSAKDVKGYLASYAPEFDPPGNMPREAWEKQRTERIEAPKSIEVDVDVQSIEVSGDEASAVIRQSYRSDRLKSTNTKMLRLLRSGDRWLIKQERVGG